MTPWRTPSSLGISSAEASDSEATLTIDDGVDEYPLRFSVRGAQFGQPADTLLALLLLPAMRLRRTVRIPGAVSPRLLAAVPSIQAHYRSWSRRFRPVDVVADSRTPGSSAPAARACLFSGGVDSFHTALRHQDEITHLVFVHGFDIDLADSRRRSAAASTARQVADRLDKQFVEVETNLRTFSDVHADWILYFGAGMAAVALLLQPSFERFFFASGFALSDWADDPPPAGSHPELDPLWSTETMEIVHADADTPRIEKIRYLARQPLAMDHLLVCYEGSGEPYNCGRCSKCLRTMASLRLMGALERCKTLPDELDLDALAAMKDRSGSQPQFIRQNLALARESDPELARALSAALEGRDLRWEAKRLRDRAREAKGSVRRAIRYRTLM